MMSNQYVKLTWILSLILPMAVSGQGFAPAKSKLKANAGETVVFGFRGSAAVIDVYTGAPGNDYAFANQDRTVEPRMILSFETHYASGKQQNPVRVKYSTDYNGDPDEASIHSARWTDLTKWCAMPDKIDGTDAKNIPPTPSGPVDITNYFPAAGQPLYLCFFYTVEPYNKAEWNNRTAATIGKLRVDADAGGVVKNAFLINKDNTHIVRGKSYGSDEMPPLYGGLGGNITVRFRSDFKPATERRAYAVTEAIHKGEAINFGRDEPLTIKMNNDPMPARFEHTFADKGDYTVVFVSYDEAGNKTENKVIVKVK